MTVDAKEQTLSSAEGQLEYQLPDLSLEEIHKFARQCGLDPELSHAGIKKERETLVQRGVYEEISQEEVPEDARMIGTTAVLTPKSSYTISYEYGDCTELDATPRLERTT